MKHTSFNVSVTLMMVIWGNSFFLICSSIWLNDVPTDYGKLCFSTIVLFHSEMSCCEHSSLEGILSFTLKFEICGSKHV